MRAMSFRFGSVVCVFIAIFRNISIMADKGQLFYNTVDRCGSNDFFDVNFFVCKPCERGLGLRPTVDKLSCQCDPLNVTTIIEYDNLLRSPICNTSRILTPDKQCPVKHLNLTISNSVQTQHVQILARSEPNCTECNPKTSLLIKLRNVSYCIAKPLINDYLPYNAFQSTATLSDNLAAITFFCQTMKDTLACNRLANLCVLSGYSAAIFSPCSLFYAGPRSIRDEEPEDPIHLQRVRPLLIFKRGKESADELDALVDHRYDTAIGSENNNINMLQVRFDEMGQLRTMQRLSFSDLNACSSNNPLSNSFQFGKQVSVSCRVNLLRLVSDSMKNGAFMDVYLNYTQDKVATLKSIPILVRDATVENSLGDRDKWQLVKRFLLTDTFTDPNTKYHVSNHSLSNLDYLQRYKSVRYVKHMEWHFRLGADHTTRPNSMSVPLLMVTYATLNTTNIRTSDDEIFVQCSFKIVFSKEHSMTSSIQIFLSVSGALAIVLTILQTYRYNLRQHRIFLEADIIGKFFILLGGNLANTVFACVASLLVYQFCAYDRLEPVIRIILPLKEQHLLNMFVFIAVPVKLLVTLLGLWKLCHVDIFFVDWERPKAFDNHTIVKSNIETPSISSTGNKTLMYDGVSAWRTFFVANEWLRLTVKRKCSMRVQMVAVIIISAIWDSPNGSYCNVDYKTDISIRLAKNLLIYVGVYVTQRLMNAVIFARYINNSTQRFVDICSLANVSVFVLQFESFGYYVHGRSPHGFADTDMCSMVMQLAREEANTYGHRGLILNSDQQTFSMLLPKNLRNVYDRLSIPQEISSNSHESSLEKKSSAYYNTNRFLNAFIDHGLKDMDYIIQKKTAVQRILNIEDSAHCSENRGVFYSDAGQSFANVLLQGNEFQLFLVELMVFVLLAVCVNGDYLMAMLGVAALNRVFRFVIARLMKRNLAQKSLLESRFLL